MIQEAYVSYEVAKLLKEKGFDIPCGQAYFKGSLVDYTMYGFCDGELLDCPSQSLVLKWLREVHDIHIEVGLQPHINEDMFEYYVKLFNPETSTWVLDAHVHNCDTYEEACEAAIKYCLKYLIL